MIRIGFLLSLFIQLSILAQAAQDEFFGDLTNQTENTSNTTKGSTGSAPIPAKHEGRVLKFQVKKSQSTKPASKGSFQIRLDTAPFSPLARLTLEPNGKILNKKDPSGATAFAMAYMAYQWFSRVTKPAMTGASPVWFKTYDFKISMWDGLTRDAEQAGKGDLDSVNYLIRQIIQSKGEASRSFFQSIPDNPENFRFGKVANGDFRVAAQWASIFHTADQALVKEVEIDTNQKQSVSQFMIEAKKGIQEFGSRLFFFKKYKVNEEWYLWNSHLFTHVGLIYKIENGSVSDDRGTEHNVELVYFYDPASASQKDDHCIIHFKASGQLSFCDSSREEHGLQSRSSVIDSEEVLLGLYDLHEGHEVQTTIAKEKFFNSVSF